MDKLALKIQKEKLYCQFYGDLVEKLIREELKLKEIHTSEDKISLENLKKSEIRNKLLPHLKDAFDLIFDETKFEAT